MAVVAEQRRAERGPADGAGAAARAERGFVSRHRLPLALAAIALAGYVGSIVYIVLVRGQIG